jgi:2-dehydro-3-deoxygluconokinase
MTQRQLRMLRNSSSIDPTKPSMLDCSPFRRRSRAERQEEAVAVHGFELAEGLSASGDSVDLVACVGEALALLPSLPVGAGADADAGDAGVPPGAMLAGAEANVAVGLAGMGVPAAWVGRLGTDDVGLLLRAELVRHGVDLRGVQYDANRPTGYYAKETAVGKDGEPVTRMLYRRSGSAASAMSPQLLGDPLVHEVLASAKILHGSGITAALSPSCAELMRELLGQPRPFPGTVCFDVNWREQLWPDGDPSLVVELAGLADVVLVGGDEALRVFGTDEPAALRALLRRPQWIVVKDGARRALAVASDGSVVEQPALRVEVVEPVGAGDAFAAGFLAGLLGGHPMQACLRLGHLSAAAVLTVPEDSAKLPGGDVVPRLLGATDAFWAGTTVSAGGFDLPDESGGHR